MNSYRFRIIAGTVVLLLTVTSAHTQPLPPIMQRSVDEYERYKLEIIKDAGAKIAVKRAALIHDLESHLAEETRANNLDAAIAMRNKIDALKRETGAVAAPDPQLADKPAATNNNNLSEVALIGKKMKVTNGDGSELLIEYNQDRGIRVEDGKKAYPGAAFWFNHWEYDHNKIRIINGAKEEVGFMPWEPGRKSTLFESTHKSKSFARAKAQLLD